MNPHEQPGHKPPEEKPPMEIWQKYYENGEYLRSAESYGEQNYDMIDGRTNNRSKDAPAKKESEQARESGEHDRTVKEQSKQPALSGKRKSVLQRLKEKQEMVAARYQKTAPEQTKEDMERNRK